MLRKVIRDIDRALKSLYNLDSRYRAESFLMVRPAGAVPAAANARLEGALYLQSDSELSESSELSIGIYLSPRVREILEDFRGWGIPWSTEQLNAFVVAAEEISHFHYLLFHAQRGRQLSQLELELQGEIDKFLLAYFSPGAGVYGFESLFERLFDRFHLHESLNDEQRSRYREANGLAGRFIQRFSRLLNEPMRMEAVLRRIRHFYRLNSSEKISFICSDR